ncbi:EamA family transporter [Polymorphobacter multimanifer]|uniref:EamA family transporter n=1 Tax=Polymorphobacter multimanifer TaxID=1070431 RepID=UPI001611ED92
MVAATTSSFNISRDAWVPALSGGLFQSAVVYALLASVLFVPVGVAVLVFFVHPVLIAIFAHLRGREQLTTTQMLAMLGVIGGLMAILLPGAETLDARGLGLAALAALGMCGVVLCAARAQEHASSVMVNLVSTAGSVLAFAILTAILGGWTTPREAAGWLGVVLAGFGIGVGLLAFLAALRRIGPVRASMLTIIEPLLGAALATLFLGERLGAVQWAGAAFMVAALVVFEAGARKVAHSRARGVASDVRGK